MLKKKKPVKKKRIKNPGKSQDFKYWLMLVGLMVFFSPDQLLGQSVDLPFKSGENARYGAYYNWNFIWVQSGEVVFEADTLQYDKQKVWHLEATGKTLKAYDLLFQVRDTFETFSNYQTFQPVFSSHEMHHGKEHSVHQYWFNEPSGKIKTRIVQGKNAAFQGNIPFQEHTYDLLATAYNFRKFDFDKLFVGQKVPYRMIIDKKIADLYFRYLGKETVKTRNGNEYRCHKVSVYLLQGDFFPEGEYMKVWFTDDKNHLPIQVETEVLFGSVKALLLNAKSLKYPLTSKIK